QAESAVSMARTSIGIRGRRTEDGGRMRLILRSSVLCPPSSVFCLHWPHLIHVREVMAQEVLDAMAQRRSRGRAAGAGALHVEIDDAVLEAAEGDVAAVVRHRGAHPGQIGRAHV